MTSPQNGFNTTVQTMDTAASRVDQVRDQIDGQLSSVRGSVEQLAGSVWRGAAQARFQVVMADWQHQSRKLNEALSGISETLRSNRASFENTDDDATAAIGRAAGSGPLNI